jgi:hypothetical protein
MKKYFLLAILLGLLGCSTKSGVIKIGDNQYMASSHGGVESSGSIVKIGLFKEAEEFCKFKGQKVNVMSSTHKDNFIGSPTSAEVQFSCIN